MFICISLAFIKRDGHIDFAPRKRTKQGIVAGVKISNDKCHKSHRNVNIVEIENVME